jgi:uncharacterized membrane protein
MIILPELKTILLALTPLNELRGTIPVAMTLWDLSPLKAFIFAVIGNMVPIFFLLWALPRLTDLLRNKNPWLEKFFLWLFERTRRKFYKNYSLYGDLGLLIFVAIPLPFTGAWTGAIAAFVFGIPYWRAFGLIFGGVIIAGLIVTLATMGLTSLI